MRMEDGRFPQRRGRRLFSAFLFLTAISVTFPGFSTHAALSPFLTLRQTSSSDISAFTKWTSVMPRYASQRKTASEACYGEGCLNREWEALLEELRTQPARAQLAAINDFFNAIPYVSDAENYSLTDFWQTPYELMEHGGDCEDYAIAKYISLRRLGFLEQDLRLLVVHDNNRSGMIHAVLEVTLPDGVHILDNQEDAVMKAARVDQYEPVYAINETRWWSFK